MDGVLIHNLEEEDFHLVHGLITAIQRMKGCRKLNLMKCRICLVRMLIQTSPKIRVSYPLWMLIRHQELMEVSSIFYVGCWFSCALVFIFFIIWQCIGNTSYFFDSMGTIFPVVASFAVLFPKSVHLLRRQLGLDKDRFIKYVVCPKCHTLYNFDDCYELACGRKVTKKCAFVQFPNHRQHFRCTKCGEPLLKEVSLRSGGTKLYPHKVYCYNSIIENLRQFLQRPGFVNKCELWRSRDIPDGFLAGIFDGRIWKEGNMWVGDHILAAPRNYAFLLNVDWFQPFKHSLYSVGVLYGGR